MAANWEIPWLNDTLGVALMTIAVLLLFRMIKSDGVFYSKVLLPVSKVSYGMYLCHMLLLSSVSAWLRSAFGIGQDGMFGIWTTPIEAIGTAVISFCGIAIFCVILQRIPRVGQWIV